ncbi:hypothetical protein B5807_03698 [Epicoccum nigrum]|uniref:Uncharacterized protein n=1 Tax=Epicoccum nigrum TaxID=105696 RepID=A0A1Y2M7H2_EPING|nr:hypothetical protein B5807_03698 [Epicoccum nigrum]
MPGSVWPRASTTAPAKQSASCPLFPSSAMRTRRRTPSSLKRLDAATLACAVVAASMSQPCTVCASPPGRCFPVLRLGLKISGSGAGGFEGLGGLLWRGRRKEGRVGVAPAAAAAAAATTADGVVEMALKGMGDVNVGAGRRKRCDGGGRGVFGCAGLAARTALGVGEDGEVRRRFGRGPGSKSSSVSPSSCSSFSGETCWRGSGTAVSFCHLSPPPSSPSSSSSDMSSSSTGRSTPNSPSSSSSARDGLDCSSILSTRANFRPAFARGAYAAPVSPLPPRSSTLSRAARGVTTSPTRTGATTKRFAGVILLNCSCGLACSVCVCALTAWRRLDFGLGLGV